MANLQNVTITDVMRGLSKIAPVALVVCALLSFVAVAIFSVSYYETLLIPHLPSVGRGMAILIAAIQEFVRFALLVSSVRDFSEGKQFNGWLGLVGSGLIVWHDMSLAYSIATSWSAENPSAYTAIFYFLILIGLLLEIRLILTVGAAGQVQDSVQKSKNVSAKKQLNGVV